MTGDRSAQDCQQKGKTMTNATTRFNYNSALYECVTEYGIYEQVHISGDYGLFQEDDECHVNCLVYANGESREVSYGEEHEIDGAIYVATSNGWLITLADGDSDVLESLGPVDDDTPEITVEDVFGRVSAGHAETPNRTIKADCTQLSQLAESLGYESIKWDAGNDCYSGYGASDPMDRSRDNAGGFFLAADDDELAELLNRHNLTPVEGFAAGPGYAPTALVEVEE